MPIITLNFPNTLNVSVQKGDIAYFTSTTNVGNFDTAGSLTKIGEVTEVGDMYIMCDLIGSAPTQGSFIMFAKDKRVNNNGLLGYFAKMRFRNDSKKEAELYAVAVDMFESSK
mgnify:CR=1 FL=1